MMTIAPLIPGVHCLVQFANFAGTDLDGFFTEPQVRGSL